MSWQNNDFRTYPVRCFTFHREAALISPTSMPLGAWKTHAAANAEAVLLRKFRYLVRHNPGFDFSLDKLMAAYTFRTRLVANSFGDWSVMLSAKPDITSDLLGLNPDLAGILA